jgi:hypothetical protein
MICSNSDKDRVVNSKIVSRPGAVGGLGVRLIFPLHDREWLRRCKRSLRCGWKNDGWHYVKWILTGSWNVGTLWKWLSDNAYPTVDSPQPRYYNCTKN